MLPPLKQGSSNRMRQWVSSVDLWFYSLFSRVLVVLLAFQWLTPLLPVEEELFQEHSLGILYVGCIYLQKHGIGNHVAFFQEGTDTWAHKHLLPACFEHEWESLGATNMAQSLVWKVAMAADSNFIGPGPLVLFFMFYPWSSSFLYVVRYQFSVE